MKLYMDCHCCGKKIYLDSNAETRYDLLNQWGPTFQIMCPHCKQQSFYDVNEVNGEFDNKAAPGAVVGGLIGLLAGPIGLIAGGTLGGLIGNNISDAEKKKVERFNRYFI